VIILVLQMKEMKIAHHMPMELLIVPLNQ